MPAVTIPLLNEIVIIFSVSVITIYIFNKIKLPPILGFLLAGIIVGPYGLGLVQASDQVEILAEIGVIFILFSIGLEFSVTKLLRMRRNILQGGMMQVLITIAAIGSVALIFFPFNTALFLGFLAALSSTAIILKLHQSAGTLESPPGNVSLSILIFQDIAILPMILLVPLIAGTGGDLNNSILSFFAKIIGIGLFMVISIKFVMPKLVFLVAKTRIKELFAISVLAVCLLAVWLSAQFGISLALGAFLAGLILSETEFNHDALELIEPFKDIFASFFFVSIGMLLNLQFVSENMAQIFGISFLLIIVKFIIVFVTGISLGYSGRSSFITGMVLAQVGEFSFVLAKSGYAYELIGERLYQTFIASAVITITATPFMFKASSKLASKFRKSLDRLKLNDQFDVQNTAPELKDHLVIIGYGANGKNLAKAAFHAGLEYVIIEMNPVTVKTEKAKGINILYGDATQSSILKKVHLQNAKFCVVAISDPTATREIASIVKKINPGLHLLIRTRFIQETEELLKLGADEVIPEEFETSVEIFSRILTYYLVPYHKINEITDSIRSEGYKMLREQRPRATHNNMHVYLPDHEVLSVQISGKSKLINTYIRDLTIREQYSVSLIAIKQDDTTIVSNPSPDIMIRSEDILLLFGAKNNLKRLMNDLN